MMQSMSATKTMNCLLDSIPQVTAILPLLQIGTFLIDRIRVKNNVNSSRSLDLLEVPQARGPSMVRFPNHESRHLCRFGYPWPGTLPNRCIGIGRRLTPQESDGCETTADGGGIAADRFSP